MSHQRRRVFAKPFRSVQVPVPPGGRYVLERVSPEDAKRAQNERREQIENAARGGPSYALSRLSFPGRDFFTPHGLEAVARGEPSRAEVNSARMDLSRLLGLAYRPGAENLCLVSWLRANDREDVIRSARGLGFDVVVPINELLMLLVGYTTDVIFDEMRRPLGQQAVAVVAFLEENEDGSGLYAYPMFCRDLTYTQDCPECYERLDYDAGPGFYAAALLAGFNLVNEVHSSGTNVMEACLPWAPISGDDFASAGPLLAKYVPGPVNEDGVPRSYTYQPVRYAGISPAVTPVTGFRVDSAASFMHLPQGCVIRGRPYGYLEAFPWAIVPGNVRDPGPDGIRAGDVVYHVPAEELAELKNENVSTVSQ